MFFVDRPSYLYSHPAPSHHEYYGHNDHPARGRSSHYNSFGHGVDEAYYRGAPHARELAYHPRDMHSRAPNSFDGIQDHRASDPWVTQSLYGSGEHTRSLAARVRRAEAEAALWRARAERAEHYSNVLRSHAESQAHSARRPPVRGRNSHDETTLSPLVDFLRSRDQLRREQSTVNQHSRSHRVSPTMLEHQRPVQDAGLSEALQPLLDVLGTSLQNRSPGPHANDTAPNARLSAQASDPVQASLARLFEAYASPSGSSSRTSSEIHSIGPAPRSSPEKAAHAQAHLEQGTEPLKQLLDLFTGCGPDHRQESPPADALASLIGSFAKPFLSNKLGQAGAAPSSSSGSAPPAASQQDALASLISSFTESFLGAQRGDLQYPSSTSTSAPASSGSSTAGPSAPGTAADPDTRIPFVAKGKWRAEPSPTPLSEPAPVSAEDEATAERMAAQVAADAAFAAALQAEEDGRCRPVSAPGISIREPGSDGGMAAQAPAMPALLEQLLGRAEQGGEMREVVNNVVQALFPAAPATTQGHQAGAPPAAGPSSRPASVASSSSTSAPAARSSPTPAPTPLETIERIASSLHALTSSFALPASLDFAPGASSSSLGLAHTPVNAALHAHEAAVARILDELDAVGAAGDEHVRARRREVVREVEHALEALEHAVRERRPVDARGERENDVKGYEVDAPAQPGPIKTIDTSTTAKTSRSASTLLAATEGPAAKVEAVEAVDKAEPADVHILASASGTSIAQDASAPSALLSSSPSSTSSSAAPPSLSDLRPLSSAAALTLPSTGSVASAHPPGLAKSDEEAVVVDVGVQAE